MDPEITIDDMEDANDSTDVEDANDSADEILPQTVSQVIKAMEEAWLNEKFAPEILPHKYHVVESLLEQMSCMEKNIEAFDNSKFQKPLYQIELDRIRFVITSYLRQRLEKIETYVFAILKQEEERTKRNEKLYLNDNELEFAKAYSESLNQHFEDVLKFWPGFVPDNWKNDLIQPNMHSFVFFKSKTKLDNIIIDEGKENEVIVDIDVGSQAIIPYESIMHLLKNKTIHLI